MWKRAFERALDALIRTGALEVTYADGETRRFGEAGAEPLRIAFHDPALPRKILLAPDMAVGEAYMDARLTIEGDDLAGFMALILKNRRPVADRGIMGLASRLSAPVQRFADRIPAFRAKANVKHHYDLSGELYELFLDEDRQYSCAYFRNEDDDLDTAQRQKKAHVAKKLLIEPGQRVLDIGCGWGGLAITLAQDHGARVVGVTLSEEQHAVATRRVAEAGLAGQVEIRLEDYRLVAGPFDRIVSVGMFEHVGRAHYLEYFDTVRRLLTPDGIAMIHTIGTLTPPRATSPWVRRYIFPGGYLPALSEVVSAVERAGLAQTDIEIWRKHYALTLNHWRRRFEARADEARALFDDRFVRMWRYYLTAAERSFLEGPLAVFQVQLARDKLAVPITRDYLYRDRA